MSERAVQAVQWGLETEYQDAFGQRRSADPEALAHLIEILSQSGERPRGMLPQTCVIRSGRDRRLPLEFPSDHVVAWTVFSDGHVLTGANASSSIEVPNELPVGTYRLRATIKSSGGDEHTEEANLLIAPERAYQGAGGGLPRVWTLAVQLYGVRSRRNWGHGDFTDLVNLIDLAGDIGAAGIALNPLCLTIMPRSAPTPPTAGCFSIRATSTSKPFRNFLGCRQEEWSRKLRLFDREN
jgi:4-alpha-glucanotransferase